MKLLSITIRGYKSISEVPFTLNYDLNEQTYSLIGINEAGKSSFLEAISFFDEKEKIIDKKFFHKDKSVSKRIEIVFEYQDCVDANNDIKEKLKVSGTDQTIIDRIEVEKIIIKRVFEADKAGVLEIEKIDFKDNLDNCQYDSSTQKILLTTDTPSVDAVFDLQDCLLKNFDLLNICYRYTHKTLFWKSSTKYLIDEPVDLTAFKSKPRDISVPLSNCFNLIGVTDDEISAKVDSVISDPVERKNFISQLEKEVTVHIKNVWKEHRIKICFDINSNLITFLVEDEGVEHDSKTTQQRSDGFRQFISFLLSISAENRTGELQDYILVIDEPEQHLHPKAVEFLKEDLIKISAKKEDNNIVFYATHSLFMIDQDVLKRNYSVTKVDNRETAIKVIDDSINTYSSVIYNVFNVYTNDYHNELVGWIQDEKQIFDSPSFNQYLKLNCTETKPTYIEIKKDGSEVTHTDIALSLYIRHQIHHPENSKNTKFTKDELIKSTDELVKLKANIVNGADTNIPAT